MLFQNLSEENKMKTSSSVRAGIWILIVSNLLMAFGSIWVLMRMSPAIEHIIARNERSLYSCEVMLASLAAENEIVPDKILVKNFEEALDSAKNNITEEGETRQLENIEKNYKDAFEGNYLKKEEIIDHITKLSQINRQAMIEADLKAKQYGYAGAWAIVFMAGFVYFTGLLFKRSIIKNLLAPIDEIHKVIIANLKNEKMRRCSGTELPKDIERIYLDLNKYIDKNQSGRTFFE
jgi:spermidine/putrescine-binding protein